MKKEVFDFYSPTALKSYNLDKTMQYQLNILGSLDIFTRKHCENVANITCRLCERLHCNSGFTEYCIICAYLHDIGKQFIPPEILQKPGRLTDEEYEIMKTHTTIGYKICMDDLKLRPYAAGPLYHHEALNGSGYPKGLTKKDIPYEGQIIRVADEYDAIVSKRQYKSHVGISDTLKIIIENTKPFEQVPASSALQELSLNAKLGKDNPVIVKALIGVVIEDIQYEIYCVHKYIKSLEDNIKRLKTIEKYDKKRKNTNSKRKKEYYLSGMEECLLANEGETVENYLDVLEEYQNARKAKKAQIEHLYHEISIIKKLKV